MNGRNVTSLTSPLATALAALVIVLAASALAWGSATAGDPQASTSASAKAQLKSLKKRVAALTQRTTAAPTGPAGGDLGGAYPNPQIATNAVNGTKLASGSVTSAALGQISYRPGVPVVVNGNTSGSAFATCLPGEEILGGEAGTFDNVVANPVTITAEAVLGSQYTAFGWNHGNGSRALSAKAICLAP